ncbi:chemotaxis protein CheY [beta proteobacterium AAP121]|nr:chemotaxis protein CheY [beta proteobacterium AAP65]KPF99536.1 chemotaxis protein CheY [beta proteobacterium AAP121]
MNAVAQPLAPAVAAPAAVPTVLCVDDEPNILTALQRVLRGLPVTVMSASGGEEALALMQRQPAELVISDMRMPGMNGVQLLEQLHQRWPQTVRILLTGHAELQSAVSAVNRGAIFRYLQKPWNEQELLAAVREGLERLALQRETERLQALTQHQNAELQTLNSELEVRVQARTAELSTAHQKLKRGYLNSIRVFANLLELRGGPLAGHGRRVAEMARDIAVAMEVPEEGRMTIFVAGLVHDLGLIGAGDRLLQVPVPRYTAEEGALYRQHPATAEQSLMALEEMLPALPLVRGHHERWDGGGFPDKLAGAAIPLGARILAVADAFDELCNGHLVSPAATREEARTLMRRGRGTQFDPEVLDVFLHITEPERKPVPPPTLVLKSDVAEGGMVLARDLISAKGMLMLTAGHVLTPSLIRRIREFEEREGSRLDIHVQAPARAQVAA